MREHVAGCVIDELGGGVTSICNPHEVLYRMDGENVVAIRRRDSLIHLFSANDLDAVTALRLIRCLMFATERLMQMEFAKPQQIPAGSSSRTLSCGNEVVL